MNKTLIKIVFVGFFVTITPTIWSQCFTKISGGNTHIVAQKANGTVWAWGQTSLGVLGNGLVTFSVNTPQQIGQLNNWSEVTAGRFSSILIANNGALWSSGYNDYGQIGNNSTAEIVQTLVQIGTATNWKQVVSTNHALGVKLDGTLWAWGQNDGYQLGDGSCCIERRIPGQVGTATDWNKVGVSASRSCFAIKNNGTLWRWGSNLASMIGESDVSSLAFPTQCLTDNDWADLRIGYDHALGLKTNGKLWAWGGGGEGQNGDGLPLMYVRSFPAPVLGNFTWKAFAAGFRTSYGIKTDGTLWAWGWNEFGQLGLGNTVNQIIPMQIGTANDWASVTAGNKYAAALKNDGSLWTWGDNWWGVLGNGTNINQALPAQVAVTGCALPTQSFELEKAVTISPNPVKADLEIRIVSKIEFDNIIIVDLTGKEVYQTEVIPNSQLMVLNVSNLSAGIYNVVFKNGNVKVLSKKLIKE